MDSIIQVFRMTELSTRTRKDIIKALGTAIDNQMGMNITGELVVELVLALDYEFEPELYADNRYKHILDKAN